MNELYFAKAFDQSPVGMVFLQADGTVLSANPALLSMLNKELWVVLGAPLDAHLRPDERPRWTEFFSQFQKEPVVGNFDAVYLRDGAEAWWSLHLSNLGLEWSGGPTYFAVLQDVTVRRLAEQKLEEARHQAELASRAKSDFLANMSHEIRTPLFTITGLTDLLRLEDLKRDQAHHAGQIASAAQHLLDLVNEVLDFSKIEAGQMSLESIPLDLDEVVGRSLEVMSLQAYRKGIELVLDLDPSVRRHWLGDPHRLRQVLVNLLGNAVKFTHQGRVTLVVEPGPTFRVRDTGIGMTEVARRGLFQLFTQADSSTTRQYGGTGLGLAISQKLVGMLGGRIEVVSEEGQGTEFSFSIALPAEGVDEPVTAPPPDSSVLVVDDDPGVRSVLERRLSQAGFTVTSAAHRAEAHEALAVRSFSVVLIDQELGPEDGWQLASEIRSNAATATTPLVLMSLLSKTLEPSPRYPVDLFRRFIDKPVNTRALIDVLTRGLGGGWPPESAAAPGKPSARTPSLRILVAEDHIVNRELFRMLLQSLGHQPFLAENGRAACEAAAEARPHLVFMDLQMPVMNGYDAARELRRMGLICPIVAVTASALKGELERCRDAGMDGILTKPFSRDTLESVVKSYGSIVRASDDGDAGTARAVESDIEAAEAIPVVEGVPEVFVFDEALKIFLGNRELLVSLIGKFRKHTGPVMVQLDEALLSGNARALCESAHALKGSAANLTAKALARAAEALEIAAADYQLDDAETLIQSIKEAFADFDAAVAFLTD